MIKIINFFWISFFLVKILIKKFFFVKKKNPDIYYADRLGFFYNQSDIRYVPISMLWDILKICRVIFLLTRNNFISIYVRGGISTGNFTKNVSDLDLVLVCNNIGLCEPSTDFVIKNISCLSKKYSKIDITLVDYNNIKNNLLNPNQKLILNLQSAFLFGKNIKTDNKISKNDPQLWSFFSSYLSNEVIKKDIIKALDEIEQCDESKRKRVAQQVIKTIVRGVFEQNYKFGSVYTKNLMHIKNIYKNVDLTLNEQKRKQLNDCLDLMDFFDTSIDNCRDCKKIKTLVSNILSNF